MRRFQRRSLPIAMEWLKRTTTTPAITVTTGEVTTAIPISTGTIITTTDDLSLNGCIVALVRRFSFADGRGGLRATTTIATAALRSAPASRVPFRLAAPCLYRCCCCSLPLALY